MAWIGEQVVIGEGTVVEDGVMIKGPAIIGRRCQIRHGAYIREHVIVGDDCVVGNACELKQSVLFNRAQVPHFNYVGDSILGHRAHLGAGVKISNVKLSAGTVTVEAAGERIDTGLRKFGALIGDGCDVGCNAVLNPGQHPGARFDRLPERELAGCAGCRADCQESIVDRGGRTSVLIVELHMGIFSGVPRGEPGLTGAGAWGQDKRQRRGNPRRIRS